MKLAVMMRQRIMRIQLISGMYTCPCNLSDVCTTFTRGKQPSAADCLTIENVAEIIAWLAIEAATVARTNIGQYNGPAYTNRDEPKQ